MEIKLIFMPKRMDGRSNIEEQQLEISRRIATMVFDLNPKIFKEVWVSFFSGIIHWKVEEPGQYYKDHSYYYMKEGE